MFKMIVRNCILLFVLFFVADCSSIYQNQRAVSIVQKDKNGNFVSNFAEVEKILMDPKIKDLKVAVVSITGKYRRGKSFLLNFLLRYLNSKTFGNTDENWMGSENEELKGFSWKSQSRRVTTGIQMWSEIFVTEVNNEKIAIVLIDSQGTFDDDHTMMEHTKVFSMVTLLSSFEIYNVKENIQEDDLQVLATFTHYAEQIHNKSDVKMGQHLQFLVRDWMYPHEFPYGSIGGKLNLNEKLSTVNRKQEFVRVREALKNSYEDISSYLMPFPGYKLVLDPKSKGETSAMDPMFVKHLRNYVPSVFSKENLTVKKVNGKAITVGDLLHYIRHYEEILTANSTSELMDTFEIQVRATFELARKKAIEVFEENLNSDYYRFDSLSDFEESYINRYVSTLEHFNKSNIKGSEDIKEIYASKLKKDMNSIHNKIKEQLKKWILRQEEIKKDAEKKSRVTKTVGAGALGAGIGLILGGPIGMIIGAVAGSGATAVVTS